MMEKERAIDFAEQALKMIYMLADKNVDFNSVLDDYINAHDESAKKIIRGIIEWIFGAYDDDDEQEND